MDPGWDDVSNLLGELSDSSESEEEKSVVEAENDSKQEIVKIADVSHTNNRNLPSQADDNTRKRTAGSGDTPQPSTSTKRAKLDESLAMSHASEILDDPLFGLVR
ncbi:unnamed protein product [Anisakis simplex]|uniref:Uncharacterized protein n=1 Tax=Anisakis simplex TaxID=6269 RepID=A0A0M3KJ41_ANISI|nr:unnamed protein product [Anisakis simplex]VDK76502.1 unnamed protein product [Anisakis simplex]